MADIDEAGTGSIERVTPLRGACHCGNIKVRFVRRSGGELLRARACGCTFCQKHGGVWTSDPTGSLRVSVADSSRVNRYVFGTGTAEFLVCRTCGVVPAVLSEIDGVLYAVVNVNALDVPAGLDVVKAGADFSDEQTDARLERRQHSWIADVEVN